MTAQILFRPLVQKIIGLPLSPHGGNKNRLSGLHNLRYCYILK